ncbi:MAG TPA: hypothetical protein VLM89_06355 [Phycisphaerae bacterium]|nr:hypothetical protein [Phycisphaerae bacterium]
MTRKELLDALQSAMMTESASALAIRNMVSTFTWSGLPPRQRERVTGQLDDLAVGPEARAQRIKQLIAQVQGSTQDVF